MYRTVKLMSKGCIMKKYLSIFVMVFIFVLQVCPAHTYQSYRAMLLKKDMGLLEL